MSGFRPVPPEPWGRRLGRAREQLAGMRLDDAAAAVSWWMPTTASTISRLEKLQVEPVGARSGSRRALAFALCHVYGVDPAEFGVSVDDIPVGWDLVPLDPPDLIDGEVSG